MKRSAFRHKGDVRNRRRVLSGQFPSSHSFASLKKSPGTGNNYHELTSDTTTEGLGLSVDNEPRLTSQGSRPDDVENCVGTPMSEKVQFLPVFEKKLF